MANTIGKLFILFLAMLLMLSVYGGRKNSNTTLPVIQKDSASSSHNASSQQQWKRVAAYADRLTAKANNAEQYFDRR